MLFFTGMASALTITAGYRSVKETRPPPARVEVLLTGSDFGLIRRQALAEHPIGSRIEDVADAVGALGFACRRRSHLIENTTAPTVFCRSMGRGATVSSRLNLTLVARNGTLTDIAVNDGLDELEASAETPDPNPGGHIPASSVPPVVPDPEWDAILANAGKRYVKPPVARQGRGDDTIRPARPPEPADSRSD